MLNRKVKVNVVKAKLFREETHFSLRQLSAFALAFAIVGGFILWKSFAAGPLVASLQAEQMSLPTGASVITDTSASAGKALRINSNGMATGSVSLPSAVTSLSISAKGAQCQGAPVMTLKVDGTNVITNAAVSSTSWTSLSANTSLNAGDHSLSVSFTNDYSKRQGKKSCSRDLYVDITYLYGPTAPPTPTPTVSLGVSPSSVTAGQAATLSWNSTNATACSASGAWSGNQATSGSLNTGALNTSSTYNLTCTGTGGSATASANVAVSAVVPPPVSLTKPTVILDAPVIPAGATKVEATPATLQSMLTSAPLGSYVQLRAGTYRDAYNVSRKLNIVGYPGERAVCNCYFRLTAAGSALRGGFVIDGPDWVDNAGAWIEAPDVIIERMEIRNSPNAIYGGGSRTLIRDNWLHHNGRVIIGGNVQRHGIYFTNGDDVRIVNNVIEDNQGFGIQVYLYNPANRLLIQNNTMLRNGNKQWGDHTGASGIIIDAHYQILSSTTERNIVANHASGLGIRKGSSTLAGNVLRENASWNNSMGSCPLASTISSASNFTFYCQYFTDGGGNFQGEPFTASTNGYGSTLYHLPN